MRTHAKRGMVPDHAGATNVGVDDHHIRPSNVEASNTTLSVSPLPGGPGQWDIPLPDDAEAVMFTLRGPLTTHPGGPAKVGVIGVCSRAYLEASTVAFGSPTGSSNYGAIYSQAAGALYLSDKFFSNTYGELALSEARIVDVTGSRYLRLEFTNFAAGYRTLDCRAEIGVVG